ncbi:MAG: HAD-IB family phosphatase [Candidatus Baltobacteraceae bacterium]
MDYDATITDVDTFNVLVQHESRDGKWRVLEEALHTRAMTLREVLAAEASLITCTLDEADVFLTAQTRFDPCFAGFVAQCGARNVPLTILSSGIAPLIEKALQRNGVAGVPVRANGVEPSPDGWIMHFRDESDNGHDKAAEVREAKARGSKTVYIGDGFSDFEASLEADVRFAKAGHALVRYLRERRVSFREFSDFSEVAAALF